MKKLMFVAAAFAASSAFAAVTAICDGTQAPTASKKQPWGASGTIVATPVFVKVGFDVMCSNNVALQYDETNTTLFRVGAASLKGNQRFGGNSNGGAVRGVKCAADPCTAGDAATAAGTEAGS